MMIQQRTNSGVLRLPSNNTSSRRWAILVSATVAAVCIARAAPDLVGRAVDVDGCMSWDGQEMKAESIQPPTGCETLNGVDVVITDTFGPGCVDEDGTLLRPSAEFLWEDFVSLIDGTSGFTCGEAIRGYKRHAAVCAEHGGAPLCINGSVNPDALSLWNTTKASCALRSAVSDYLQGEWEETEWKQRCAGENSASRRLGHQDAAFDGY